MMKDTWPSKYPFPLIPIIYNWTEFCKTERLTFSHKQLKILGEDSYGPPTFLPSQPTMVYHHHHHHHDAKTAEVRCDDSPWWPWSCAFFHSRLILSGDPLPICMIQELRGRPGAWCMACPTLVHRIPYALLSYESIFLFYLLYYNLPNTQHKLTLVSWLAHFSVSATLMLVLIIGEKLNSRLTFCLHSVH